MQTFFKAMNNSPKPIRLLAVRDDSLTFQAQTSTWRRAAEVLIEEAETQDRRRAAGCEYSRPYVKFFTSLGEGLEEHTLQELREALTSGEIDRADIEQRRLRGT